METVMSAESPTRRERLAKRFPALAYHLQVLKQMPTVEIAHRAASWVTVLGFLGLALALAFNAELLRLADATYVGFDARIPLAILFLLFAFAFMKANYAEIEQRDGAIAGLRDELNQERTKALDEMRKDVNRTMRSIYTDWFKERFTEGNGLLKSLRDDPELVREKVEPDIDAWILRVRKQIADAFGPNAQAQLDYFNADTGMPETSTEWRPRLFDFVSVRLTRLGEIWQRYIHAHGKQKGA